MSHHRFRKRSKSEVGPSTQDTAEESHQLASTLLQIRSGGSPTDHLTSSKPYASATQPDTPSSPSKLQPMQHQRQHPTHISVGSTPLFARNTSTSSSISDLLINQALRETAQGQFGSGPVTAQILHQAGLGNYLGFSNLQGNLSLTALQAHTASSPISSFHRPDIVGNSTNAAITTSSVTSPSTSSVASPTLAPAFQSIASPTEPKERRDSLIRKDQVEAALKSKPQRGRKREDLNELERLELTRSRNREHAKTTRVRKKARYQELLQEERQLQEFQQKQQLEKARRATVAQFVKTRQEMILATCQSHSSPHTGDGSQAESTHEPSVDELVEDVNRFEFDNEDLVNEASASASARMASFDNCLAQRVESRYGSAALALIQYNLQRGDQGISLDCVNGAMAEIYITLSTDPPTPIQKCFLRVQFSGSNSKKLSSASWQPTRDYLERPLNAQVSHPSVVSLDPAISSESATALLRGPRKAITSDQGIEETQGGPGMNI